MRLALSIYPLIFSKEVATYTEIDLVYLDAGEVVSFKVPSRFECWK